MKFKEILVKDGIDPLIEPIGHILVLSAMYFEKSDKWPIIVRLYEYCSQDGVSGAYWFQYAVGELEVK